MVGLAIRLQEIGDAELEEFVERWLDRKAGKFVHVLRIGAANDKGRDVIGFLSDCRHEGPWELYQCKRKTRDKKTGRSRGNGGVGQAFLSSRRRRVCDASDGVLLCCAAWRRWNVTGFIVKSVKIGPYLIGHWDQYCAEYITSTKVPLTSEIRVAALHRLPLSVSDQQVDGGQVRLWIARPLSDEIFGALIEESGSHTTLWWREMDSNPRSLYVIREPTAG